MALRSREYFPETVRINCGKSERENRPNSAPRTRTCQVQSLVMRVLTLAEMSKGNLRNAEQTNSCRGSNRRTSSSLSIENAPDKPNSAKLMIRGIVGHFPFAPINIQLAHSLIVATAFHFLICEQCLVLVLSDQSVLRTNDGALASNSRGR